MVRRTKLLLCSLLGNDVEALCRLDEIVYHERSLQPFFNNGGPWAENGM